MEMIDLTPTWTTMMPALIHMIQSGGIAESAARTELMRLAAAADRINDAGNGCRDDFK